MVRPILDSMTKDIDHTALRDLSLESGQKFTPGRAIVGEIEGFGNFRLSGVKEGAELGKVYTEFAVVVLSLDRGSIRYRRIVLE
jgi:hypothetical protein